MGAFVQGAERVPAKVVFTTDDLPPAQRLDAWNAAFGSLNEISVRRAEDDIRGVRSENWQLGAGLVLSVTRVPPSRFIRHKGQARRDGFDHWALRVLQRGHSLVRHAGFDARLGPGEPLFFSADESWVVDWTEAEWVSLCISRDLHPQLSAGLSAVERGPLRGVGAGLLADLLLALPGRLAAADAAEVSVLAQATQSLIAACLLTGAPVPPHGIAGDLAKERVRQAIRRHIGSARLTPERLAAAAGLSRSALYRMFEAEGGVASYIRDVRLAFAHAALRDPRHAHRGIAELAEAHGFPDPSPFSRAFRQAYGMTPGEVRALGLPGPAPARSRNVAPTVSGLAEGDVATQIYGLLAGPRGTVSSHGLSPGRAVGR
jgi:AraC-like DNA-binding protein